MTQDSSGKHGCDALSADVQWGAGMSGDSEKAVMAW